MTFQRARTQEQISERRAIILKEAEKLYQKEGLMAVTFTNISKETSFTRQAIYKYYQTREEVLLDLLKQYYQKFLQRLGEALEENRQLTGETYARILTDASLAYPQMLSLFSILYTVLEENVSTERLVDFKRLVYSSFDLFHQGLESVNPDTSDEEKELFDYHFILLISSLYPVTHPTAKQQKAIDAIKPQFCAVDIEKLCYTSILQSIG